MTPEQVSALSDEELELAMRDCYMPYWKSDKDILRMVGAGKINYITDYNLTMPLVIEKGVSLSIEPLCEKSVIALCEKYSAHDKSLLRAACECLVLIALADK